MKNRGFKLTSALIGLGAAALLSACFEGNGNTAAAADAETEGVRPTVEKGVATPKAGEMEKVPSLATNEGDFALRGGQWVDENVSPLAKEAIERYNPGYITDIKVVAGSTSGTACPSGYSRLDVDLNRRAGGKWIFFCYKTGAASDAINLNHIEVWAQGTYGTGPGNIRGIGGVSNGDMNQGAAGAFVFGTYLDAGRGTACRMTGIGVITDPVYNWQFYTPPSPWSHIKTKVDLNQGAGGDFIYLVGRYEHQLAHQDCIRLYQ